MIIEEITIQIKDEMDIVAARKMTRDLCKKINLGIVDETKVVTAVSELSRNIINYAQKGVAIFRIIEEANKKGIEVLFQDSGPGIPNIDKVLQGGYSTGGGLGRGISGSKELMDFFDIRSEINKGTTVRAIKWQRKK